MSNDPKQPKRSEFWASVRLLLVIVIIVLVPMTLQQMELDPERVKLVGRIVAGVGLLLIALALVKQIGKVVAVLALALLALMVLASEGIIEIPQFLHRA